MRWVLIIEQLFFLDSRPTVSSNLELQLRPDAIEEEDSDGDNPPAWVDSDDERIAVSLASNSRLRKLRRTEAEDVVSGKEYTRRLREQYERLYPIPEWASREQLSKKRRRISEADGSSERDNSADEISMDDDSESLSAQPLAQLLQNASPLNLTSASNAPSTAKLRPELIDIQRSKDVGGSQPVSFYFLKFKLDAKLVNSPL